MNYEETKEIALITAKDLKKTVLKDATLTECFKVAIELMKVKCLDNIDTRLSVLNEESDRMNDNLDEINDKLSNINHTLHINL